MAAFQPNPGYPIFFDPAPFAGGPALVTAAPVTNPQGNLIIIEQKVSGNFYLIPANRTLNGFAALLVTGPSGFVEITDTSNNNLHEVAPGGNPPAWVTVPLISEPGGGGGRQLSITVSGAATLLSAIIAGYQ